MRLGFAVKVLGDGGLPTSDNRRWQSEPHLRYSLDMLHGLLDYCAAPADDVALVLVHSGGQKGSGVLTKLRKLSPVTEVKSEEVKPSEMTGFLTSEVASHGGTATAFDDSACALIDPDFARPLRPVAAVPQLDFEELALPVAAPAPSVAAPEPEPPAPPKQPRARKGKPPVPAWEDVLLGVRTNTKRPKR